MRKIVIIFLVLSLLSLAGCISNPEPPSENASRTIQFSGYTWKVKSNLIPAGPGPNIFSNSSANVWVDANGSLHMKITQKEDNWSCAEIISENNFGYGEYVFTLGSDPGTLDPEIVLGLFTWDDQPEFSHREIDIEFSRWRDAENSNAQYVVQPWDYPGNIERFDVESHGEMTTHSFKWQPDRITFTSYYGPYASKPAKEDIIKVWEYDGVYIPQPGNENARINLWLVEGRPPTDLKENEYIVHQFIFIKEGVQE